MEISLNKQIRVFIQDHEGRVIDITGNIASFSINHRFDELITMDLELVGSASNFYKLGLGEFEKVRNKKRTAPEWRCDYCGQVNKRENTFCDHCGGRRSFLYD